MDLVGSAPVGYGVEVVRQRCVPEDLGLLVARVLREREGVVGCGGATEDEGAVSEVLAELGIRDGGGGGGGGGERADGKRCGEWRVC